MDAIGQRVIELQRRQGRNARTFGSALTTIERPKTTWVSERRAILQLCSDFGYWARASNLPVDNLFRDLSGWHLLDRRTPVLGAARPSSGEVTIRLIIDTALNSRLYFMDGDDYGARVSIQEITRFSQAQVLEAIALKVFRSGIPWDNTLP